MYQILVRVVSRYAPVITFPVAVVLGFIGYSLENKFSSKKTPYLETSIEEERLKRLLNEKETIPQQPATIFERNNPSKLK